MPDPGNTGIYEIVNLVNGKRYVGSAVNVRRRWNVHRHRLQRGNHHSPYLQRAWDKHGAESFDFRILEECEVDALIEREQFYIDRQKPAYNMAPKAGSALGVKWSKEARARHRELQRANPAFKGRKHSPETIERMRLAHLGRPSALRGRKRSPEAVEKTAAAHRGKTRSGETRAKIAAKAIGRKFERSDEYREAMSARFKGKAKSPEHMAALQEGRRQRVYTDEQRAAISEAGKRAYAEGRRSRERSPEYRAKIAATLRARAKDPAYRERMRQQQALAVAARRKAAKN